MRLFSIISHKTEGSVLGSRNVRVSNKVVPADTKQNIADRRVYNYVHARSITNALSPYFCSKVEKVKV